MTKIFIAVAFAIPTLSAVGIAQTQRFLPPTPASPDPFVSRDTTTVLAQDFDGDGRPDLFFANTDGPSQLLRNVGPWRFAQIGAVNLAQSTAAAAADVDGDGDLDLVLSGGTGTTGVALFRNDGGGSLTNVSSTHLPPGTFLASSFAFGDVDGDGDADLVLGIQWNGQNRLFVNNGLGVFTDGTFGGLPFFADSTSCVRLLDVDGDQDLDLFTGNDQQQSRLARNDGAGHFTDVTASHLPAASMPLRSIGAGDIDGDGDTDLVLGVTTGGIADLVYVNDGTGHFTDQTVLRLPQVVAANVALLDADGDQDLDLIVAQRFQQPRLFRNGGNGVFSDVTATMLPSVQPSTQALTVGDLDGDGRTDVCFGCDASYPFAPDPTGRNVLLQNQAGGLVERFAKQIEPWDGMLPIASLRTNSTVLIDHDHDGDLDLVIGNDFGEQDRLYENDGHGVFTDVTALRMPVDTADTVEIAAGDVNGDSFADLVLTTFNGQSRLYFGSASGGFVDATAGRMPAVTLLAISVALGDLDNDGDLDIVLGADGSCRVFRNNGLGVFVDLGAFTTGTVSSLALADFDADGDLDVFAAAAPAVIYRNDGVGNMTPLPTALPPTYGLYAGTAGDFDGDGLADLFVSRTYFANEALFLRNLGNATFATAVGFSGEHYDTTLLPFDQDGDGDLDVLCASQYVTYGTAGPVARVYENQGGGAFVRRPLYDSQDFSRGAAVGDVDGDGDPDVILGNRPQATYGAPGQTRLHRNLTRHLSIVGAPLVGTTQGIHAWTVPPIQMQNAPRLAAICASFGLLPAPIALPPFGSVQIDPTSLVVVAAGFAPPSVGDYATNLVIPNNPALVGLSLFFQAVVEGRAASGVPELRLTNASGQTIRL